MKLRELFGRLVGLLLVLYCVKLAGTISADQGYQWDFYSYYHAAKAYENGVNPYDAQAVSRGLKEPVLAYSSPPITLHFFRLFTKIDYPSAYQFYFFLKCITIFGLIFLWRNVFLKRQTDLIFYLFCVLAFNSAFYLDLRAGNISMLEQLMIWLAFFFYLKRRYIVFCALIMITAILKIQPILFLFLMLFAEDKKKYRYLFGSFIAFGSMLLINYLSNPHLFLNFLSNASSTIGEKGISAPSTLAFIQEFVSSPPLYWSIYLATCFILIFVSGRAVLRLKAIASQDRERWFIFFACLVYSLICPRFKDYSYILLIVPTYFIIKRATAIKTSLLLFVIVVGGVINGEAPGGQYMVLIANYYPLTIACLAWGLYIREIRSMAAGQ